VRIFHSQIPGFSKYLTNFCDLKEILSYEAMGRQNELKAGLK
jgi:hypothetical protein